MSEINAATLQKVLDGQNKLFEGLQQLHHKLDSVVLQFRSEIDELKRENKNLKKELHEMAARLDRQEQFSRSKNVVIYDVPGAAGENRTETEAKVSKIASVIKFNHKVVVAHRLGAGADCPILAVLESKAHAQEMLSAVRQSSLSAADIDFKKQGGASNEKKKIAARPHLCTALAQLRKEAAALKAEANWGWTKVNISRMEVQIYKGRDEKGNALPPITVKSLEDILKLRLQLVEEGILPQITPELKAGLHSAKKRAWPSTTTSSTSSCKEKRIV